MARCTCEQCRLVDAFAVECSEVGIPLVRETGKQFCGFSISVGSLGTDGRVVAAVYPSSARTRLARLLQEQVGDEYETRQVA